MLMSEFGEDTVRKILGEDGTITTRYHPLSKSRKNVSYDFFITEWRCLGEVKTKFNSISSGFTIPKSTLVKYREYSRKWNYEYIFFFVDITSKTVYQVGYHEFKKDGEGTYNENVSRITFRPTPEHILGYISPEDYKDFTLNYTKTTVKHYDF